MNTCPGCNERVAAGEEECSHCGTPLLSASAPGSSPVIAGRKTYIAGAGGGAAAGGGFPAAPTARKTRIEGEAVPPPNKAADEELYVPKGRRAGAGTPLDPKDPFARAVMAGGTEASPSSAEAPAERGPRRKTNFWSPDPDSKPTLVGDQPSSDPWASTLSPPPDASAQPSSDQFEQRDTLAGFLVSFSLEPSGALYPIRRGKTAIGRTGDPGLDVELDDGKVSSPHCLIIARPSGVFLQDSMSTNGTWFRRGELTEFEDIQATMNNSARLEDGDFVRVGDSIFLVRLVDPAFVRRVWGD